MLDIIYYILYIILCMHNHLKPEFDAGRDGSAGGGFYGGSQK